jgi:uncharacterized protein (DUF2267 family)
MRHDEFIGQVQHRARLASRGDAERATRAALQTLGERLGAPDNLAAQLPPEIGRHLMQVAGEFDRLTLDEFFARVADKEECDVPESIFHARVVMDVLRDAVGDDTVRKAVEQLPDEFLTLFESGSEGQLGDGKRPLAPGEP